MSTVADRKSLRQFLLLCILTIVILAGAITVYFSYNAVAEQVEELFDAEIAQMARVLQSLLKGANLPSDGTPQTLVYEDFVNSPFDTFTEDQPKGAPESNEYGHKYETVIAHAG